MKWKTGSVSSSTWSRKGQPVGRVSEIPRAVCLSPRRRPGANPGERGSRMEAPHDPYDLNRFRGKIRGLFLWILILPICFPVLLPAQEKVAGEGEHRSFIISEGKQVIQVGPVKPGQTIQVFCTPQWNVEEGGRVEWVLTDGEEKRLRAASQKNPDTDMLLLEWTSNSAPAPKLYRVEIGGKGGDLRGRNSGAFPPHRLPEGSKRRQRRNRRPRIACESPAPSCLGPGNLPISGMFCQRHGRHLRHLQDSAEARSLAAFRSHPAAMERR